MKMSEIGAFVILVGCTPQTASTDAPKIGALIVSLVSDRVRVIAGPTLGEREYAQALAGEPTLFHWVSVEVPEADAPMPDSQHVFDLGNPNVDITFQQSYEDSCNPSDPAETGRCWLRETYHAGTPGLSGTLSLSRDKTGILTLSYEVDWQGITDRFGPLQWHRHMTTGRLMVASADVADEAL